MMDSARYHKANIGEHAQKPETLMLGALEDREGTKRGAITTSGSHDFFAKLISNFANQAHLRSAVQSTSSLPAHMDPCPDHIAVNRAYGETEPFRDLGIGQTIDPIEKKGGAAERRQFGKGSLKPPQLPRAFASRLRTSSIPREVVEFDIFASIAGSDFGLSRQIYRQMGGNAKQIGARMFEGCSGAALKQTERGVLHDILRLLASCAAPGKGVQFMSMGVKEAREYSLKRGHKLPPRVERVARTKRRSWQTPSRRCRHRNGTWDDLMTRTGAAKGHAGRANGKAFWLNGRPRYCAPRKPYVPA